MNQQAKSGTENFEKQVKAAAGTSRKNITGALVRGSQESVGNLEWLIENMPPYFFITMKDEDQALMNLARGMAQLGDQNRLVLDDRPGKLSLAMPDKPGSIYNTLTNLRHRAISYAEMTHSRSILPGSEHLLEVQRFEFDLKNDDWIAEADQVKLPTGLKNAVKEVLRNRYPDFDFKDLTRLLSLLVLNNPSYADISPPERIARGLWMHQQAVKGDGLFVDLDESPDPTGGREHRLLFSVINPPQSGFLAQVTEIFQRLDVGVRRFYCLGLNTGEHTAMLGSFYIVARDGRPINQSSDLYRELKKELYTTRILNPTGQVYQHFISRRIMTGEQAALTNAFIAFCHSSLAHNQPDRFDLEVVRTAFCAQPDLVFNLLDLFRLRFDPEGPRDQEAWDKAMEAAARTIEDYNTGHRNLDRIRQTIFRTCLLFIKHTLKTNFFVDVRQALAFRLDPAYLIEMGPEFTADLPQGDPFRVTFLFGREGFGYHVGFSDIARGGWRTIISTTGDEYIANTDSLFREIFVLAHTQHLKNKDIYEGGSKMAVVLDARECASPSEITQTLQGLQRCILNAFLDILITAQGSIADPRVVDYYGDDEPIELGPDENMGDDMIEHIARQALARGYVLGVGLISSKRRGINHKEYGVTSRGVVRTAVIAMSEMGLNPGVRPFTVRFTGGPSGDVAGNAMRLLIDDHPTARITGIVDGPGLLHDPSGADRPELRRLTLAEDVTGFDPTKLHQNGFIVYRHQRRREALRNLHRMVVMTGERLEEQWITADEYQRLAQKLTFSLESDLFLPCGGRPETVDDHNWPLLLDQAGIPATKLIVEGANSFITPRARVELQEKGVVIIRDASANKCGVIASSYEIISNLLMTEREFAANKEEYVRDVLEILDRRATEETTLIFKRWRALNEQALFTEISAEISREINDRYADLFSLFQERGDLMNQPLYRRVILNHLPTIIGANNKFRSRLGSIPYKVKCAILASEIASMITYRGGWEDDLESRVTAYLKKA